jgi:hypothetical protein
VTFAQKIALVGSGTPGTAHLPPGIRRLNAIRNRLAHSLRAEVTREDAHAFLQIGLFRAMRDEKAKRASMKTSTDPIDVLEEFAMHAGISLHASATRNAELWAQAFRMAKDECSEKKDTSA